MDRNQNHLSSVTIIDGTSEHFESTRALCDERFGRGYCTQETFGAWISHPGLFKVALYDNEYAGFAVMLPADEKALMKHMQMTREETLHYTQGKPALIYKSAAVQPRFERRGIMKAMAACGLKSAKELGFHTIFASAWVYQNTIPIENTFRVFGFTRLFDKKLLWYDDENYHCVICNGRCKCDGIIYYKKL